MPRSVADATRFTATGPYASSKGFLQPSAMGGLGGIAPEGETPLEKVARLRAAKEQARLAEITTFDRVVMRGRTIADRLHRITALSLIGLTVLGGGLGIFAISDMIVHVRKSKQEYFANQLRIIEEARDAVAAGTATEEQIAIYERERPDPISSKPKEGVFKRAKEWLFSGLKKGDEMTSTITASGQSVLQSVKERKPTVEAVKAAVSPSSTEATAPAPKVDGGYLDLLASGRLERR